MTSSYTICLVQNAHDANHGNVFLQIIFISFRLFYCISLPYLTYFSHCGKFVMSNSFCNCRSLELNLPHLPPAFSVKVSNMTFSAQTTEFHASGAEEQNVSTHVTSGISTGTTNRSSLQYKKSKTIALHFVPPRNSWGGLGPLREGSVQKVPPIPQRPSRICSLLVFFT